MSKLITPYALLGAGLFGALCIAPAARADDQAGDKTVTWGAVYKGDVMGAVSGGRKQAGRYLDDLELTADVSLEKLLGWSGAHVFAHGLSNAGGAPNDIAETMQGVDNIEVGQPRAKLYQLWIEQNFANDKGSALAGLYDLNSEFYHTDAAGLLMAPAFGVGSELAATGPNGPSIFPSTALALRVRWKVGANEQVQGAILNAKSGVIGDPGGVNVSFDGGALAIAEWARTGDTQIKVGAWRYTEYQDDIRDLDGAGDPVRRPAEGAYASVERKLWAGPDDVRAVTGFLRAGLSDGDTTPYQGGWQTGLMVSHVFASRPDSAFSIGVNQAVLNSKFRANALDAGDAPAHAESALELTYADKLNGHLTLQPDLQLIRDPGADAMRADVVVAAMRITIEI